MIKDQCWFHSHSAVGHIWNKDSSLLPCLLSFPHHSCLWLTTLRKEEVGVVVIAWPGVCVYWLLICSDPQFSSSCWQLKNITEALNRQSTPVSQRQTVQFHFHSAIFPFCDHGISVSRNAPNTSSGFKCSLFLFALKVLERFCFL